MKYIPVEIVGAYVALRNIASNPDDGSSWPAWLNYAMFVTLVVLNVMYLRRVGGDAPKKQMQISISCIAFLVWSYAMGGPVFDQLQHDLGLEIKAQGLGAALLVLASLGFGLYDPNQQPNRGPDQSESRRSR